MYCKNLKKRKGKPFCVLLNREINLSECSCCCNKEYKEAAKKQQKSGKKAAKKWQAVAKRSNKITKLERKRFSILTDDLEHCIICGNKKDNLHEVFYGSKHRTLSMQYGCVVPLCVEHHKEIHNNIKLDSYYKKIMQIQFAESYRDLSFEKIFHRNYE